MSLSEKLQPLALRVSDLKEIHCVVDHQAACVHRQQKWLNVDYRVHTNTAVVCIVIGEGGARKLHGGGQTRLTFAYNCFNTLSTTYIVSPFLPP